MTPPNVHIEFLIREVVEKDLRRQWTIGTVAKEMQLTKAQLEKKLFDGMTDFDKTIFKCRTDLAAKEVIENRLSEKEIAALCGYKSHDDFMRAFRKRFKDAPAQYRERAAWR